MIHCQSASLSQPEASVIVDQGMLKVSEMVKSISFDMQGQRVPGRKEKYMFIPNASTQCEKYYMTLAHRGLSLRTGSTFSRASRDWDWRTFCSWFINLSRNIWDAVAKRIMKLFKCFQELFEFAILQFLSITLHTPLSILTSGSSSSIFIACQRHPSVKCEDGYDYDWRWRLSWWWWC